MAENAILLPNVPMAASLTGAKILGLDNSGASALFNLTDIKGDYKGVASTAGFDPGVPVLNQYYTAVPGLTYTNFKDASNASIVVPLTVSGQYVIDAKMSYNGTYWLLTYVLITLPAATNIIPAWTATAYASGIQVNYNGVDYYSNAITAGTDVPGTSVKWTTRLDMVVKTKLITKISELLTTKTSGYWASGAANDTAITASGTLSHTNEIVCSPGDKFVILGITSATITGTSGAFAKAFDVSGNALANIGSGSLVADSSTDVVTGATISGYILTIPATTGITKFGINFSNTDTATVSIKKGALVSDTYEKVHPNYLPIPVTDNAQIANGAGYALASSLVPLNNKMQILDNAGGTPDYGFVITPIVGGLTITWTGAILLSYSNDPSTSSNRYGHLIASSGTRTITLDSLNATTVYIKKSDFTSATAEIIPIYYCRWGDDALKDPNNFLLITKNKSQSLKDCMGPLADFIRNSLNEKRISTLETNAPAGLALTKADNEAQNLFLRAKAKKDYTTGKKYGIIAAGQSNTDGRVLLTDAPSWLNQADPSLAGVNMWDRTAQAFGTFKLGVNSGADSPTQTLWAYDMVLYYLLQQFLADNIYVVKRTRGGTAIDPAGTNGGGYWNPYFERVPSGVVLMDSLEQNIRAAMAANTGFKFKAFVWHQGEADYLSPAQDNYYQNFKNVIAYVRGIVDDPKLPVIFGTISTISAQYSATVKAAQQQIATEDPYAHLIDMGAATLLDAYHFDTTSAQSLGTQMFNIAKTF